MEGLGYLEFSVSVLAKHIHCQISADQYETYKLAKEHSEELAEKLSILGYEVGEIYCTRGNPKSSISRYRPGISDIDIMV